MNRTMTLRIPALRRRESPDAVGLPAPREACAAALPAPRDPCAAALLSRRVSALPRARSCVCARRVRRPAAHELGRPAAQRRAAALALALLAAVAVAGCGAPAAVQRSQELQLAAMVQYRDEMAAYHEKVKAQLADEKRRELDGALAASLAQAADAEGRVPLAAATEKVAKRLGLEDEFRRNLARLDGQFAQRQADIGRAIGLARGTLDLLTQYGRLASLVRSLFVRETEAQDVVNTYETERSVSNAGSPGEPEASSP